MSRALRIAMLAPFGIRPKGTLSARMLPLGQALARRGHTVTIVAPPVQNPEDAGTQRELGGVVVEHTRLPAALGPAAAAEQAWLLLRGALRARPDVLHLFKPKGYGGLAALAAARLRPGLPLVLDTDDWEGWGGWNDQLPYPLWAKALFDWQERDLPRRAAAVTVVSRTLGRQARGAGVPPAAIFSMPNGVREAPPQGPRPEREARTLLLYTRFWEFDVRLAVAALAGVAAREPQARLLVVGRGERGEERELLRLAGRAGLAGMVDYHGWAEPGEIPGLLGAADVALAPMDDTLINRARGLAKMLELMAAGLPIVASRVGQAAEYLQDGESGLLVPPGDAGALAAAAVRLLGDSGLRARLSAGARAAAARLTWDALALRAEAAYELALSGKVERRT